MLDAVKTGKGIERIYLQNNLGGRELAEIAANAAEHKIPVSKVPLSKLEGFNVSGHEGCIALLSKIQYQDLQEVISFVVEKGEIPLFLILDGITDIRNIGAIARSAYAMGVHALPINLFPAPFS